MKDNQHEQLFTELTPEQAGVIEGGQSDIQNTYNRPVTFHYQEGEEWLRATLPPGEIATFGIEGQDLNVTYDARVGFGYDEKEMTLLDGENYAFESPRPRYIALNQKMFFGNLVPGGDGGTVPLG
ncbi:MAG: hypothetical protein QNJ53_17720 [Pleurocapsa sp. MO_192.B19]|nr:hypothetical protein [Pleurocapsa sp. MO_192.B19]